MDKLLIEREESVSTGISYSLPGFEGPLDLLLHLVRKHKLDIVEIPIAELLRQYIETIEQWKRVDLEIATEFLEMAARLVLIKSSMLLPKHEEEAEQMRRELSGELIEYELCRKAAARLAAGYIGGDLYLRDAAEIEPDHTYRILHSPVALYDAYFSAAGRGRRRLPPPAKAFSGIIERKVASVSSKILFVLRKLYRKNTLDYHSLFEQSQSKSELVATFLALLELIKGSRIRVDGDGDRQTVTMLDTSGEFDGKSEFDGGSSADNNVQEKDVTIHGD